MRGDSHGSANPTRSKVEQRNELPARRIAGNPRVDRTDGWLPVAQVTTESRLQADSPSQSRKSNMKPFAGSEGGAASGSTTLPVRLALRLVDLPAPLANWHITRRASYRASTTVAVPLEEPRRPPDWAEDDREDHERDGEYGVDDPGNRASVIHGCGGAREVRHGRVFRSMSVSREWACRSGSGLRGRPPSF